MRLTIWDTAGQERYHALNPVYYRGAEGKNIQLYLLGTRVLIFSIGALIVYDITDQDSFNKVNTWIKELRKYLPLETPIIIAGNKCDMQNRVISLEEAEKYEIFSFTNLNMLF